MTIGHLTPLTELERDALGEVSNIAMARAANSLRQMVEHEVLLSVPAVEILSQDEAAQLVAKPDNPNLVAVRQDFSGAFAGRALLIFPEANSLQLVRAVTQGELSPEEVIEIEREALVETGNVILNSCLATMSNLLKSSLSMTIPELLRGSGAMLFEVDETSPSDGLVLFLYIDFAVRRLDIRGYIAMIMDLPALETLRALLDDFIARVVGDDA